MATGYSSTMQAFRSSLKAIALTLTAGANFARPANLRLALTIAAALCAWPTGAWAHAGHEHADARMAAAPRGIGKTCLTTANVEGLGAACRLDGGLWGVRTRQGRTVSTHGADAATELNASTPRSNSLSIEDQIEINDAGARDGDGNFLNPDDSDYVSCVTDPSQARLIAVYARASGTADRSSLQVPRIRAELRRASRFIDIQALDDLGPSDTPGLSRRLKVQCTAQGLIDVKSYELPTSAAAANFSSILSDLTPLVMPGASPTARAVVFYDQPLQGDGAAVGGQGGLWWDTAPGTDNANNDGGALAVQYNAYAVDGPRWDVLLHEIMHNMGAVQKGTAMDPVPDSNTYGHCTDDADIMCYDEGSATTSIQCNHTQLDCGNDTYFHAGTPEPSSWLATHWNVASVNNRYLAAAVFDAPPSLPLPDPNPVTPQNTALPQVTGTGYVGETLTCAAGTWTDAVSTTREWTRGGIQIATGSSYVPAAGDAGASVQCVETATSSTAHTAEVSSVAVSVTYRPVIPTVIIAPAVSGSGYVGEALTCTVGSWTGAASRTYRWMRGASQIATGQIYTPGATDVGSSLVCEESATSATGHAAVSFSSASPTIQNRETSGTETTQPPAAILVKLTTRLFSGSKALWCTSSIRPCTVSRTARLSARGTLSTKKAVTMKLTVEKKAKVNGRYVWKRIAVSTFSAAQGSYSRAVVATGAGRYRMRVETVASASVQRSVGAFVYFARL